MNPYTIGESITLARLDYVFNPHDCTYLKKK